MQCHSGVSSRLREIGTTLKGCGALGTQPSPQGSCQRRNDRDKPLKRWPPSVLNKALTKVRVQDTMRKKNFRPRRGFPGQTTERPQTAALEGITRGPDMSETPEAGERRHSEVPAEGDPDADGTEIRVHTQDPAEGPDTDD
jgi:hypothetical protein